MINKSDRNEMDPSNFGIPELRKYPLIDIQHVNSAISYFYKCDEKYKQELANNIIKAQIKLEMKVNKKAKYYEYVDLNKLDRGLSSKIIYREVGIVNECMSMEYVDRNDIVWDNNNDRPLLFIIAKDYSHFVIKYASINTKFIVTMGDFSMNRFTTGMNKADYNDIIVFNSTSDNITILLERLVDYTMADDAVRDLSLNIKNACNVEYVIKYMLRYYGIACPKDAFMITNLDQFDIDMKRIYNGEKPSIPFLERCGTLSIPIYLIYMDKVFSVSSFIQCVSKYNYLSLRWDADTIVPYFISSYIKYITRVNRSRKIIKDIDKLVEYSYKYADKEYQCVKTLFDTYLLSNIKG